MGSCELAGIMPRHLRVENPGAIYHVTCRMIGDVRLDESRLFRDDREREYLLDGRQETGQETLPV